MAKENKKRVREEFRDAVFRRDRYRCRGCGLASTREKAVEELDAHHITDRHVMPNGGYVAANGISLCPTCHEKAEVFHSTGVALEGWAPADLYEKIGSNEREAIAASHRLATS
jgi:predicted restriction endonuclease